jgi:hypothetical protein
LGEIYIAGSTTSTAGIALNGFQDTIKGLHDCFLAKIIDDTFTAQNETKGQNHTISLFPNPTTGSFRIGATKPVRLLVYNQLGQCVFTKDQVLQGETINIQGLPGGSYVAQFVSETGSLAKKIIVVDQ